MEPSDKGKMKKLNLQKPDDTANTPSPLSIDGITPTLDTFLGEYSGNTQDQNVPDVSEIMVQQQCQRMFGAMYSELYNHLYRELYTQLHNQLYGQLYDRLYNTLYNQLYIDLLPGPVQESTDSEEAGPSGIGQSSDSAEGCSSMRRKRHRSFMSDEQHGRLESEFAENPHPTSSHMNKISSEIGLEYKKIRKWFDNQRTLSKKRKTLNKE